MSKSENNTKAEAKTAAAKPDQKGDDTAAERNWQNAAIQHPVTGELIEETLEEQLAALDTEESEGEATLGLDLENSEEDGGREMGGLGLGERRDTDLRDSGLFESAVSEVAQRLGLDSLNEGQQDYLAQVFSDSMANGSLGLDAFEFQSSPANGVQNGTASSLEIVNELTNIALASHEQVVDSCGCGFCESGIQDAEDMAPVDGDGSDSAPGAPASLQTLANYLTDGYWNDTGRTRHYFNVEDSGTGANFGTIYYNVSGFTSMGGKTDTTGLSTLRKELVRDAFDVYEEVLGINFVETTSQAGHVDFFFSDNYSGANATYVYHSGVGGAVDFSNINISSSWSGTTIGDGIFRTAMHEIGHSLGLGHQGNYNAGVGSPTYANSAHWMNDSRQQTIMSYWSPSQNTDITASNVTNVSPMAVDWLALDALYGSQTNGSQNFGISEAFLGNTIFGVGTNITNATSEAYAGLATWSGSRMFSLVDGGGIDTLDVSNHSDDQKIDLSEAYGGSTVGSISDIGGLIGNMTIAVGTIIENANSGSGDDTIYGNSANNTFYGGAGNDRIFGYGGADRLYGDLGNDSLYGSSGADYLYGGDGADRLYAGSDGGRMYGGADNDTLYFYGSYDNEDGYGGSGINNFITYGGLNEFDDYYGGVDNDNAYFYGSTALYITTGSSGTLNNRYGGLTNALDFHNIEDVYGGSGNDSIIGDAGVNRLYGNDGSDYLYGGAGNDYLVGGAGSDRIYSGSGNNYAYGGDGNDEFYAGGGDNRFYGGDGYDELFVTNNGGSQTFYGGTDSDDEITAQISGANWAINLATGLATASITSVALTNVQDARTGSGDDTITGNANDNVLQGGSGNDTIEGGDGNDYLYGGDGDDILNVGAGSSFDDIAFGGAGNDRISRGSGQAFEDAYYGGLGVDTIVTSGTLVGTALFDMAANRLKTGGVDFEIWDGFENYDGTAGSGDEDVSGTTGRNLIEMGSGENTVTALGGNDTVYGGDGNDIVYGGDGHDRLYGDGGDDRLYGDAGIDQLYAGAGDNRLYGGADTDYLYGGSSTVRDAFYGGDGNDYIYAGSAVPHANDDYYGGAGDLDVLSLSGISEGGTFDMEAGTAMWASLGAAVLTMSSFERLFASSGADTITGTVGNNTIWGWNGGDTIDGKEGDDLMNGGSGDDVITAYRGADSAYGGAGDDQINTSNYAGDQTLEGGSGTDLLNINTSSDWVVNLNTGVASASLRTNTISGFENVTTGNGSDSIYGDGGDNTLSAGSGNDSIFAGLGDDVLNGGAGNDSIFASSGKDTINGGSGSDTLNGWTGDDVLDGDSGDDTLYGVSGNDTLDGGTGVDLLYGGIGDDIHTMYSGADQAYGGVGDDIFLSSNLTGDQTIDGGSGTDQLILVSSSDWLVDLGLGTASASSRTIQVSGIENVTAGTGDDTVIGDAGDNILNGGSGNDTLMGGAGADSLVGGSGTDTASYANSAAGLKANLSNPAANTGDAAGDAYYSIENLIGSAFNDVLVGDGNANMLDGGDGNDALIGGAGADSLVGGAGLDTANYLNAAAGLEANLFNSVANTGDAAGDTYSGIENLAGSAFNDILVGDAGANLLFGSAGNDALVGGAGGDTLNGGAGNDTASYVNAAAGVRASLFNPASNLGDAAGDIFVSVENLTGSAFDDVLVGGNGVNILRGLAGDDSFYGGASSDTLIGGDGADLLNGGSEGDVMYGGNGDDTVFGGAGDDVMHGNNGNDLMNGGAGADTLYGGADADMLLGGAGADILAGGTGFDTVSYASSAAGLRVNLGAMGANTGDALGDTYASIESVIGSGFGDTLVGNGGNNILSGGNGNDSVYGGAGADQLNGDAGNDILNGGAGDDTLDSGDGNDILTGGAGADVLIGGLGDDSANYNGAAAGVRANLGTPAANTGDAAGDTYTDIENLIGTGFGDTLVGDASSNRLSGLNGSDSLYGGDGGDTLSGNNGADILNGGDGNDVLYGGDGADLLVGGEGKDTLGGGAGADTFDFNSTSQSQAGALRDVVTGFNAGAGDRIDLATIDASLALGGNQAFNFIGGSGFSNTAGELRFVSAAGTGYLSGDINGDGVADITIQLNGVLSMSAGDIIL